MKPSSAEARARVRADEVRETSVTILRGLIPRDHHRCLERRLPAAAGRRQWPARATIPTAAPTATT